MKTLAFFLFRLKQLRTQYPVSRLPLSNSLKVVLPPKMTNKQRPSFTQSPRAEWRELSLEDKKKKLSAARRRKIKNRAAQLIAQEMSLRDLRKARRLTQERMGEILKNRRPWPLSPAPPYLLHHYSVRKKPINLAVA
jgi:hypothetical protein